MSPSKETTDIVGGEDMVDWFDSHSEHGRGEEEREVGEVEGV
jgi:hypothetical protein